MLSIWRNEMNMKPHAQNYSITCMMMTSLLALISFIFLLLLNFYKAQKKKANPPKLPPSPPKLPILGNLHQLGKLPHQSLWQLSNKYGPIMLLKLGTTPTLVISSADMAEQVLQTHDINFCSRPLSPGPRRFFYNFSDVAFSPCTEHWRERKKIFVSHLLNSKRAQFFWEAREVEVNYLMESISMASPNIPVNLDEHLFNLVDGLITAVAFGKSYRGKQFEGHELKEVLDEAMDLVNCFSAEDFFPSFGRIIDIVTGHSKRVDNCFRKVDCYLQNVIEEHLIYQERPMDYCEDFVDVLIGLSKDQSFAHLNNDHIKAILMNTFLGGVNSAAIAMVWAMSELIKNPRVMQKVQTEIRGSIGIRKLKLEANDLKNLKYLNMVVKETLRMHPPAPLLLPRETIRHCIIGGGNGCNYDIYPKTRVLINAWAIGRDPHSWKNPNEFFPERFYEEHYGIDYRGKNFEFVPFGGGRRFCPGVNLAIATIEFTLANLLYFFDWKVPSGMKLEDVSLEEERGVTSHKKTPLFLVPIKNEWN